LVTLSRSVSKMSRAALLCCTTLALVLGAGAAHGQSWRDSVNLPKVPFTEFAITPKPPPVIYILHDDGGRLADYVSRWSVVSLAGNQVEVLGRCGSGCTILTAYIPKDRLCFHARASLAFHMARHSDTDPTPAPKTTKWMINNYPADIRGWIEARGGVEKMSISEWWTLPASELWEMGYRKCND
jgi:hypothetical protein